MGEQMAIAFLFPATDLISLALEVIVRHKDVIINLIITRQPLETFSSSIFVDKGI